MNTEERGERERTKMRREGRGDSDRERGRLNFKAYGITHLHYVK